MKKALLATLTAATLAVFSPLALAQATATQNADGYLNSRTTMYSQDALRATLDQVQAQQQAASAGFGQGDTLARVGHEQPNTPDDFNAIYGQVAANRALIGTQSGEAPNYLAARQNLYSPEQVSKSLRGAFDAQRVSQQ